MDTFANGYRYACNLNSEISQILNSNQHFLADCNVIFRVRYNGQSISVVVLLYDYYYEYIIIIALIRVHNHNRVSMTALKSRYTSHMTLSIQRLHFEQWGNDPHD